jgi:hypothetical protein
VIRRLTLEKYGDDLFAATGPEKEQQNPDVAAAPVNIDGSEVLRKTRNGRALTLAYVRECDEPSQSEARDRMKRRFCELLILGKALERSVR